MYRYLLITVNENSLLFNSIQLIIFRYLHNSSENSEITSIYSMWIPKKIFRTEQMNIQSIIFMFGIMCRVMFRVMFISRVILCRGSCTGSGRSLEKNLEFLFICFADWMQVFLISNANIWRRNNIDNVITIYNRYIPPRVGILFLYITSLFAKILLKKKLIRTIFFK